jgi:hypothetical protein
MGSQELGGERIGAARSGGQFEELVDELNLTPNIRSAHPPNLPLPQHVHRLITVNRSPRRLEFSEPLLGVHPAFDRSVVLFENVVQVLYGPVPATAAKSPFLLYLGMAEQLEVVLNDGEPAEHGIREAHELLARLGVQPSQLVEGAYVDLLAKKSVPKLPERV